MREVGISYSGHKKLRYRAAVQGKPQFLALRWKLDLEKKKMENGVEYVVEEEVIKLQSMSTAVKKRIDHIGPSANNAALLSVDKGQGRVLSTIAFPYRHHGKNIPTHPCSTTNHLILKSWEGDDKYETLSSRLSEVYDVVSTELKLPVFIGATPSKDVKLRVATPSPKRGRPKKQTLEEPTTPKRARMSAPAPSTPKSTHRIEITPQKAAKTVKHGEEENTIIGEKEPDITSTPRRSARIALVKKGAK
uniref:Uncharacterized protein n=1 Tax=Acrobeloides nanus TaxID=290746 RepID=A0A914DQI5_9BILA